MEKTKKKIRWPTKVKFDPERAKAMEEFRERVRPQHEAFKEQLEKQQRVGREILEFEITV